MVISYPELNSSPANKLRWLSSEEAMGPLSQGSFGAADIVEEAKHPRHQNWVHQSSLMNVPSTKKSD